MQERYRRQTGLREIGEEGQARLLSSRVTVVGAGGLGSAVLYYLAAAGVAYIKIIDSDVVDISNLNRQFLYTEADTGREKSKTASEKILLYNHETDVSACTAALTAENAETHIPACDAVVACVDNKKTRLVLNDYCISRKIPLVDGGVSGFEGYVLSILPGETACFRCIFPAVKESPETQGVLGAAAGVIGSLMALETIKTLLKVEIDCHLHYVDLLTLRVLPVKARKNPDCPACSRIRL